MDSIKTGSFIAELRKEKGMKQQELASLLNVSDKAVSRWETGKGLPDIENLQNLADALDVNIIELLKGERISADLSEVSRDSFSLFNSQLKRTRTINTILGFLIGMIVFALAFFHLSSPIYFNDPDKIMAIETLTDGTMIARLDEQVSGYDLDHYTDPDGNNAIDISCYRTLLHGLTGKGKQIIVLGQADEIDAVMYYPGKDGNVFLYQKHPTSQGVITLPRLIYNYWLVIGILSSIIAIVSYLILRKKHDKTKLLKIILIPIVFTASLLLVLMGHFDEVYNAAYYFTQILIVAFLLYLLCLVIIAKTAQKIS